MDPENDEFGMYEDDLNEWETEQVFQDNEGYDEADCDPGDPYDIEYDN